MNLKIYLIISFYVCNSKQAESYRFLKLYDKDVCPNVGQHDFLKPIDKLLSSTSNRKVKLDEAGEGAVVVEQTFTSQQFKKTSSYSVSCVFKIDARRFSKGVFAVIRKLSFRKSSDGSKGCRDFVKFEFSNGTESEKICGEITADNTVGIREADGQVKVHVSIDMRTPLEKLTDVVEFSIVFTGFNGCDENHYPCFPEDPSSCIYRGFFNDDIQNCPHPGLDEVSAKGSKLTDVETYSVVLSMVSSFLIALIVFGSLIWLFLKYFKYTFGPINQDIAGPYRPSAAQQSAQTSHVELSLSDLRENPPPRSFPEPKPSTKEDDPPPSYDDLFPER